MARFFNTKSLRKKVSAPTRVSAQQAFAGLRKDPEALRKAAAAAQALVLQKKLEDARRAQIAQQKLDTLAKVASGKRMPKAQKQEPLNLNTILKKGVDRGFDATKLLGRKAVDTGKNLAGKYYEAQKPGIDFAADLGKDMFKRTPVAGLLLNPDRVKDITGDEDFRREDNPFYKFVTGEKLSNEDAQDFFDVTTGSGVAAGIVRGVGKKAGKELIEKAAQRGAKKAGKVINQIKPTERKAVFELLDEVAPKAGKYGNTELRLVKDAGLDAIGAKKITNAKAGKQLQNIKENKVNTLVNEWMQQRGKKYDVDSLFPQQARTAQPITKRGREIADDLGLDLSKIDQTPTPISSKQLTQQSESKLGEDLFQQTAQRKKGTSRLSRPALQEKADNLDDLFRSSNDINKLTKNPTTNIPQSQVKSQLSREEFGKRIGRLDYFKTPERALKKLGLEKEAKQLRRAETASKLELPKQIDKIEAWKKKAKSAGDKDSPLRIFQYLDGVEGAKLNKKEQKIADEIKAYYKDWADRLGLPEERRITNYVTHIFEKGDDISVFPDDIAKMIDGEIAGSVYSPFMLSRSGKTEGLIKDPFQALEAYVKRATRKVHMDPILNKLQRAGDKMVLDDQKFLEQFVSRVNYRPSDFDKSVDVSLRQFFDKVSGGRINVKDRPLMRWSRGMRKLVYNATLAFNPKSALKNLTQNINTFAEMGSKWTSLGHLENIKDMAKGSDELKRVGVLENSFIDDQTVGLSLKKKAIQKFEDFGFFMFETAEKINRGAAYFGAKKRALARGLSEEEAIDAGIEMARKTQFTFGAVDTPVDMGSDVAKTLLQFQSYNIKQLEFLSDLAKGPLKAKGVKAKFEASWKIARYVGATTAMFFTVGSYLGIKNPLDLIPTVEVASSPPFQAASAIKDYVFAGDRDDIREKAVKDLKNTSAALIPGGVQGKRVYEALKARSEGGEYSSAGFKNYDVPKDPATLAQMLTLGKSSLKANNPAYDLLQKAFGKDPNNTEAQKYDEFNFFDMTDEYEDILNRYNDGKLSKEEALQLKGEWKEKTKQYGEDPVYIEKYVKEGVEKEGAREARKEAQITLDSLREKYPDKAERNEVYKEMIRSGEITEEVRDQIKFLLKLEKQKQ